MIKSGHTYLYMLLVMLLLFATTGVTMSKHYCMGRLMSVEFNDHAEGCQGADKDSMPCCEDTTEELKVDQLQKVTFDVDLADSRYLMEEVAYILIDVDASQVTYPHVDVHSPPLLTQDIPVLHGCFLI